MFGNHCGAIMFEPGDTIRARANGFRDRQATLFVDQITMSVGDPRGAIMAVDIGFGEQRVNM